MALGSIMNLFVPKNKVFFTLFENLTETTLKMSDIFVNCINEKDLSKRSDLINIHNITKDDLENYFNIKF